MDVEFMEWVFAAYLPEAWNRSDPYLFPLQGNLTKLPPAVIYTADYDVLRDEGAAYAQNFVMPAYLWSSSTLRTRCTASPCTQEPTHALQNWFSRPVTG